MLTVVLISLGLAVLVVALIAVVIFFRAAFWGEQDMAEQAKAVLTWRPPFMRGEMLRNWAATTAEQLARSRLTGKRTGETAIRLAAEMEEGAVHAMLPLARQAELDRIEGRLKEVEAELTKLSGEAGADATSLQTEKTSLTEQRTKLDAEIPATMVMAEPAEPPDLCPEARSIRSARGTGDGRVSERAGVT